MQGQYSVYGVECTYIYTCYIRISIYAVIQYGVVDIHGSSVDDNDSSSHTAHLQWVLWIGGAGCGLAGPGDMGNLAAGQTTVLGMQLRGAYVRYGAYITLSQLP